MSDQRPAAATPHDAPVLAFDEYEVDVPCFELRRASQVVPLEPQVFEVLAYLVRNAGRVVPKDELLDAIWPERYVTDGVLNSRVMAARKAINDNGQDQRYIKTVHGRGYRFVGQVSAADAVESPLAPVIAPPPIPIAACAWAPATPPVPATSFVGREDELARIQQLLAQPHCRLVSLVGPGGVGKTRLAFEAANRAAAGGRPTAFVCLEAIADPREIPTAVAAALGLAIRSEDPAAELCTLLAQRHDLLVLDNFERLLDGAPFLHELLSRAPGITLLVTSRSVLGLAEEWLLRISGLSLSGDATADAIQLFLDRAAQANAWSAPPSAAQLEEIRDVCRLVDGLPLAIELAASLTRYLPYHQIAEQIQADPAVLSSEFRVGPERHRSVAVLLEESCHHLAPEEMAALEGLAVFDSHFTADAAATVAGAPLPLLRNLVDHSLLKTGEGTFWLHPLMHQFVLDRLGGRLGGLRERHADYYARLAESLVPALEGGGQIPATRRVDEDFLNFAAAWRWASDERRLDLLDPMAYPLFLALTFRGRYFDAHDLLQHGIAAVRDTAEAGRSLLAALLTSRAWVLFRFGRGADALRDIQEALAIQAAHGLLPRPGIGLDPRLALTVLYHGAGDYAKAYDTAMNVLEDALARGERTTIAFASWIGGSARLRQARLLCERQPDGTTIYAPVDGDPPDHAVEEASRLQRAARALLLELGDSWLSGFVEIELGLIAGASGDREGACEHYRRAYELRSAFNDPQGMASSQVYLAGALLDLGRMDEAEAMHRDILALAASIGDSNNVTEAERCMAVAAVTRGNLLEAFEHARTAAQQSIAIGFTNNIASILGTLARIFLAVGEPERAARCLAVVASHPASTPFSRAGSEMLLDSLSGVLPAGTLAAIRRSAARVHLIEAVTEAIAIVEGMQDRLAAASQVARPSPSRGDHNARRRNMT